LFLQKIAITVPEASVQPPSPKEVTDIPAENVQPLYRCVSLEKEEPYCHSPSLCLSFLVFKNGSACCLLVTD